MDRARSVEERAPCRRDGEDEGRHEEREHGKDEQRAERIGRAIGGIGGRRSRGHAPAGDTHEPQQPDRRQRHPEQQQHLGQVVDEPIPAQLEELGGPRGEVARKGRWILPGEDVAAVERERVGERLARQRRAEGDPVAQRPRQEDEEREERDGDHANAPRPEAV